MPQSKSLWDEEEQDLELNKWLAYPVSGIFRFNLRVLRASSVLSVLNAV